MRAISVARIILGLALSMAGLCIMGLLNLGGSELLLGALFVIAGLAALDEGGV